MGEEGRHFAEGAAFASPILDFTSYIVMHAGEGRGGEKQNESVANAWIEGSTKRIYRNVNFFSAYPINHEGRNKERK